MARGLYVGIVLSVFGVMSASRVVAAPAPIYQGADVKFKLGGSPTESTVVAEGLGVRVTKRIGPEIVKIRIEVAKDVVDLEANAKGLVKLARRGRSVVLNMAARDQQQVAEARRMTEGSAALKAFDALIVALEGDSRLVAQSMLTTWGLLNVVRGNDAAVMSLANRVKAAGAGRGPYTPVRFTIDREGPTQCWQEYAYSVFVYYTQYAECLVDYGWIPGMVAVCSFEWAVKSELAWFWLIACSGDLPA
jgi:hypothetical protein